MRIMVTQPRGEIPIYDPHLLPDNNAQVARNLFLRRGILSPFKAPADVRALSGVSNPCTVYRYPYGNDGNGWWFVWGNGKIVDVIKSPLANDAYSRIYWTGDGKPKMGSADMVTAGSGPYPSASYDLGITAPTKAPQVRAPDNRVGQRDQPSTVVDVVYAVTFVSRFGEESAPSPPSRSIERWDMVEDSPSGGSVHVEGIPVPSQASVNRVRIYRAEGEAAYNMVAEVDAGTSTYTDGVASQDLGGTCQSEAWDSPAANMQGLTALGNGMAAGFYDNVVAFSEPYYPHAWPTDYELALTDKVVGICHYSGGLVVGTDGKPWLISGADPAAMQQQRLALVQPCVSRRSMVDMGSYVIYASDDGLVAAGGQQEQVITEGMITREQWAAYKPATIKAVHHEGRYLAFYDGGCFAFAPGEGFEFYDVDAVAGAYRDYPSADIYLIQGGRLTRWDAGEKLTYRWRSKINMVPPGAGVFTCGRVFARSYPVRMRVFADGQTVMDRDVTDGLMFRLASGFNWFSNWELEIEGQQDVIMFEIASNPGELT